MELDLTPGALIRSGSAVPYLLLGAFLLALRPRSHVSMALGVSLVGFGGWLAVINVAYAEVAGLLAMAALVIVEASGLLALSLWLLRPAPAMTRRAVLTAGLLLSAVTVGLLASTWTWRDDHHLLLGSDFADADVVYVLNTVFGLALALPFVLGMAVTEAVRSGRFGHREEQALLLVAGVNMCFVAFTAGELVHDLASARSLGWALLTAQALVGVPFAFWLLRLSGTRHGRWGRNVVLATFLALAVGSFFSYREDGGAIGVARLVAFMALAVGVFRLGLPDVVLPRIAVRRGVLASSGLAALFITAQIAQNYLSDTLGLMLGGVVAGAVVFAAYPLQRAAEGILGQRPPREPASALASYRRLVETAWQDGRLGANERLLLAESARQLGVGSEASAAIDEEVARAHVHRRRGRATIR